MASLLEATAATLQSTQDDLHSRDEEVVALESQVAQLQRQLQTTAAENDYMRKDADYSQRKRARSSRTLGVDGSSPSSAAFDELLGASKADSVLDPRIGRPRKILVVGGGPAGLIALHELLSPSNRSFGQSLHGSCHIELYERRAEVGGVWYFEPENDIAKGWFDAENADNSDGTIYRENLEPHGTALASVDSHPAEGQALAIPSPNANRGFVYLDRPETPRWPSPAYEGLVGNVLPPLLQYSAKKFPDPAQGLFPSMTETHQYLLDFSKPLNSHIRTNREVTSVTPRLTEGEASCSWTVTSIDWSGDGSGVERTEEWDAVVVAPGAFDKPYYPETPGLKLLLEEKSPLVMHAKSYPGPRPFVAKRNKFVCVGNANSANDIAAHLAPLSSSGPVYRCIRHESNFAHLPDSRIKDVAPIASISKSSDGQTLLLDLVDGTAIEGVTKIIFATGYQYEFPWLQVPSFDPKKAGSYEPVSKHGAVPNLHLATFHSACPTLSMVGLSVGSTPIPLAEIQSRLIARVYHGLHHLSENLGSDYSTRRDWLNLKDESADGWRLLHYVRGPEERKLTPALLDELDKSESGASNGLFRWDDEREDIVRTMRAVKEAELRRLRDARVAAGGVDGGVGGILSVGLAIRQKPSAD